MSKILKESRFSMSSLKKKTKRLNCRKQCKCTEFVNDDQLSYYLYSTASLKYNACIVIYLFPSLHNDDFFSDIIYSLYILLENILKNEPKILVHQCVHAIDFLFKCAE